ncbi:22448_t:CDS:10 [Cetraspora pellucida]|uniref:22448_t:CDS:1 n=1 Tax=Cetraspora pellucida TaxID=1433469 RepID=A0A9N8VLL7_9GLOM|nr:22448_t:CDS:10 [Cetraspora pellucida]
MNLNGNFHKGQCQPALLIMQNVENVTPEQNTPQTENVTSEQNLPATPKDDLISFDENPPTLQLRETSAQAVNPLTDDVPNTEAGSNNEKDSKPSNSEYDTAEEEPDIHFKKIKNPYINRIAEARKFNEGEIYDYYAFVPKRYYAEGEPLAFFESIEEKIADIYKKELALKGRLKEAIKANRKPSHLNEIWRLRRNTNIANFEGIKFLATLHNIDKFEKSNPNYAINIFKLFYRKAFGKIKVDIDPLHISEHNYQIEHMIDLLYLTEGEESLNDRKNQNDIPKGLKTHYSIRFITETCPGPNKASQCLILPEEEAKEIEADKKDKEENTIKEAEQIAVSYKYTIYYLIENLQEDLEVILDKLHEIALSGYNKIRVFNPETKKYLGALHRKCHGKKLIIQSKLYDEQKEKHKSCKEKNRVIDHDHITGKFRGPAHSRSKVINEKIVPIANNLEQYITYLVGQLQFIDSLKFSLPEGQTKTPEQLAKCFPIMSKFISPHLLSLLTYFNSDLDEVNYCEQGCESKECEHEKIYTITQKNYDFAHTAFRKASYSVFKLDPANYLTTPGLAWDACMKVTKVKLELFNKHQGDMHNFFTAMKRGGMSLAKRCIVRTNLSGLEGYDEKKAKKWLLYLDANNLYDWAMSQYLPTRGFK